MNDQSVMKIGIGDFMFIRLFQCPRLDYANINQSPPKSTLRRVF